MTVIERTPPKQKCKKSVMICATVSDVNMKDVMYENGTIAKGKSIRITQTPGSLTLKRADKIKMKIIGT